MVASAEDATRVAPVGATTAASAFGVFYWLDVTDFGFILFFISLCFVLHITF
jgi:hypothetical protein